MDNQVVPCSIYCIHFFFVDLNVTFHLCCFKDVVSFILVLILTKLLLVFLHNTTASITVVPTHLSSSFSLSGSCFCILSFTITTGSTSVHSIFCSFPFFVVDPWYYYIILKCIFFFIYAMWQVICDCLSSIVSRNYWQLFSNISYLIVFILSCWDSWKKYINGFLILSSMTLKFPFIHSNAASTLATFWVIPQMFHQLNNSLLFCNLLFKALFF